LFRSLGDLEHPPALDRPAANLDDGAAAWVSDTADGTADLIGRRFSTRNPFTQDLELITLTSETNPGWPLHLAPGQGTRAGSAASAELVPREDPRTPGLVLQMQEGASVWITDTRYADFRLEVALEAGKAPALLAEAAGGRVRCRWPEAADGSELTLAALRTGAELVLTAGEHETACELGDARVALGLGSRADNTQLARWSVHRTGE
jgi:hypothetical protein